MKPNIDWAITAKMTTEKATAFLKTEYSDIASLNEHFHKTTFRVTFYIPSLFAKRNISLRHVYHPHDISVEDLVVLMQNEIDRVVLDLI